MCIIAYGIKKDIGNKRFQNCLTNNPDGFFLLGFKRGAEDKKPEFLIRTLLKKEVVATWEKIPNDYIVLIHARIKTHGSISEKNVHGWNGGDWYFCHKAYYQSKIKETLQTVKRSFNHCSLYLGYSGFLLHFCFLVVKGTLTYRLFDLFEEKGSFF